MAILVSQIKHHLSDLYDKDISLATKRVAVKEYLQAFILSFIYNHNEYRHLSFYGGTCARVIYKLDRLSEDIDLDNSEKIHIENLATELEEYFNASLRLKDTTVHTQKGELGIMRLTLKLPILHDLELSPYKDEKLHIKIEISEHSQIANRAKTLCSTYNQSFVATHFDLPSLMAGKMLACLERNYIKGKMNVYVKGRDFYDLVWYMNQNIQPLPEKLLRDGKKPYSIPEAMTLLEEKVSTIKSHDLELDLLPFFTQKKYLKNWLENFQNIFQQLIKNYK